MRLNRSDRSFIRAIAGDYAPEVEHALSAWPERLRAMCGVGEPRFGGMFRDLLRVGAQYALAGGRRADAGDEQVLFWERDNSVHAKRVSFLSFFAPSHTYAGVGVASRIVRGVASWRSATLLVRLKLLILRPATYDSLLAEAYGRIVRDCLIAGSHAVATGATEAYVFRPYRPETPLLCAWLRRLGLRVHLVTLTTPLLPNTRSVCADDVIALNPYQLDEIAHLSAESAWPPVTLWAPQEFPQLTERYASTQRRHLPNRVALYTQGFRMRVRAGIDTEGEGTPAAEHEERLHGVMLAYLNAHPEVRLQVFPHPMERRHFRETGEHDLGELVGHPQVEVAWEGENSLMSFDEFGVGVTTFSTVGFDRAYLGFPTLFFVRETQVEQGIESPYRAIFAQTEDEFTAKLDTLRASTPQQFASRLFGEAEPWTRWPAS